MGVYNIIYSAAEDSGTVSTSPTYATARDSTGATSATATSSSVANSLATGSYACGQIFLSFDTSAVTAGTGSGFFSLNVSAFPGNIDTDTVRIREVSSTTNKIAGGSLSALTPVHSDPGTFPTGTGRFTAAIADVAAIPRSSTFRVVVHSVKEQNNVAPTGLTRFAVSLSETTGTTSDPFVSITLSTAWQFVGVSAVVEVTAAAITLTEPAGVADGDLLIACFASRTTATTAVSNTGWTEVNSQNNNNTLASTSGIASGTMLYQVRAGTPDLTFVVPAGISVMRGQIVAYRGGAVAGVVDTSTAVTTPIVTLSVSVTGLTTTQNDDLIVAMAAGGQEAAWSAFTNVTTPLTASGATDTATAPSSTAWIERADSLTTAGADTSLAIFDAVRTTAGATGNLTATASVGGGHVVIAGAFKILPPATKPRYRSLARVDYGARTNITQAVPTGTTNGDLLIWSIVTGNSTPVTPTFPAGWTTMGSAQTAADAGSFDFVAVMAWRLASSEPANYTATHAAVSGSESIMIRIDGPAGETLAVDAYSQGTYTTGAAGDEFLTTTAPSVTATESDDLLIFLALNWDEVALTPPTGMTERQDAEFLYLATQDLSSSGATGNKTQSHASVPWFGNLIAVKATSGPTAYTLPADAGSYMLTGTVASLELGRNLTPATPGSYALTGADATLTKGAAVIAYTLPADPGFYALTGAVAGLYRGREVLALPATYALSGATASLERGREVVADLGSYALTGSTTSLELGREVLVLPGSYAMTGSIATLRHDWKAAAIAGSYALSGTAATFRKSVTMPAVAGSYALSGATASFLRTYKPVAVSGSYSLTGTPANLLKPGAYAVIGLPGAYALAGSTASLEYGREVLALGSSYVLTGTPANLLQPSAYAIVGLPGSYALTGSAASLTHAVARTVVAEAGNYYLIGTAATITYSGVIETPPVYSDIATVGYVPRTNTVVAKPVGTVDGDILLCAFVIVKSTFAPGTVTPPDGWLQIDSTTLHNDGGTYGSFYVFWKRASAAEPDDYTFTHAAASTQAEILAYSGCVPLGTPIDAWSIASGDTNNNHVGDLEGNYWVEYPSVTTTTPQTKLVLLSHNWDGGGGLVPPGLAPGPSVTMTERYDDIVYAADEDIPSTGATGIRTMRHASPNPFAGLLIALKPFTATPVYSMTGIAGSYGITGVDAIIEGGLIVLPGIYALTGTPATLLYSGEVVVEPPVTPIMGGGGGTVPKKQMRRAVRELLRREEKRKGKKKPKVVAREILEVLEAKGLGAAEKRIAVRLISQALVSELPQMFYSEPLIHDKGEMTRAILFIVQQAMQRILDEEEDEEAALLLLSAA